MPEGRMLKKAIATSKTLPELQTDTARLIYTWLIPFLDINGRHIADPLVIKGTVVPRIKSITPEIIEECLMDMHNVGVIKMYEVNGERYLQFTVFEKHQYLKSDREAKPTIPAPPKNAPAPDLLRSNSGVTPSFTTQVKLSKVKESKYALSETSPECFFECRYFKLSQEQADKYVSAYGLDKQLFLTELKKMELWLDNNPNKRKKSYGRFITNWITRANGSMRSVPGADAGQAGLDKMLTVARMRRAKLKAGNGGA
jgi:hypothetical protein